MAEADWSIAVGIMVFIIAIIVAAIYYLRYKKLFIVAFCASIATYVFAVFYTWDIFDPNKNWIMLMLIISTFIMMYLGKYFAKIELKHVKIK